MKNTSFDWDDYFKKATYSDVMRSSPELSSRRYPTTYSPDRKRLYLSSLDIDESTEDIEALKVILMSFSASYDAARRADDFAKLALITVDCFEVCGLVSKLDDDPSLYDDPEEYLKIRA